jgi:hypothetical protein
MKAITLQQPWATLVAVGAKRLETRSWGTSYRGPLAIHASKKFPEELRALCTREPYHSALLAAGLKSLEDLPHGSVLAVAELTRCYRIGQEMGRARRVTLGGVVDEDRLTARELSFGDYRAGRFAWLLESVTPLKVPEPARGTLGLWDWIRH